MSKHRKRQLPTDVFTHTATFSLADITGNNTATAITTFVQRASTDNRRSYREELAVEPPSPVKRARAGHVSPAPDPLLPSFVEPDNFAERYEMGFNLDPAPPAPDTGVPALSRVVKPSVSPARLRLRLYSQFLYFFFSQGSGAR